MFYVFGFHLLPCCLFMLLLLLLFQFLLSLFVCLFACLLGIVLFCMICSTYYWGNNNPKLNKQCGRVNSFSPGKAPFLPVHFQVRRAGLSEDGGFVKQQVADDSVNMQPNRRLGQPRSPSPSCGLLSSRPLWGRLLKVSCHWLAKCWVYTCSQTRQSCELQRHATEPVGPAELAGAETTRIQPCCTKCSVSSGLSWPSLTSVRVTLLKLTRGISYVSSWAHWR